MGANGYMISHPGHLSQREADAWLGDQQTEDRSYNGHRDGYSGDSQTVSSVRLSSRKFTDGAKAEDYILNKAEKWEFFVAVHVTDPTAPAGQQQYTLMGGWAAE